ncbi:GNAT family N-acetyltransferase [Lutispora saccharofermentans]|uniref:GNAT family N-acetyltransferase n=1 Tax=Lutispora saccharofermentans TaxID=3024236 RepID=A0ABT1NNU0_9FIRM|nr:GNAT family N-acetyltransferase [Lutispora saccharofermentans]MCQ1531601.1 GNAT family N-acetyltransferase [Lutispora saccharofermentans]
MRRLDLQDKETAEKVLELQAASYKIEAQIIDFYDIPPLKDTIDSLRKSGEIFYGYFEDEALAGIISYKVIGNTLDIHRVAVHPSFFRMGIAQKMVNFIEGAEAGINKVVVCTGKENKPAVNLYLKNGYKKTEDIEIGRNIYLTAFEKII